MKIFESEQGTEQWKKDRSGHFTASNADKLMMSKSTAGYNGLINQIVYERLTGEVPEGYSNEWMERGNELEPEARLAFEIETFQKVNQVGFIEMNEWVGASVDGLIGDDGLIEIKCPKSGTLIDYILDNEPPKKYMLQMQFQLMVTERKYCIFFVYHPKMKPLQIKVERDEKIISSIMSELSIAQSTAQTRLNIIGARK